MSMQFLTEVLIPLAIVGAVIYLAQQVRASTIAKRNESLQFVSAENGAWMSHITSSAEIARLFRLGQKDLSNLATDDLVRYGTLLTQFCHNYDAHYHVHQKQAFADDFWESCQRSMQYVLCTRGARVWWANYGHQYSRSFQELVATLMDESPES